MILKIGITEDRKGEVFKSANECFLWIFCILIYLSCLIIKNLDA